MQNILFRADASSTIGIGHVMRDLVLAKQFKQCKVIFATQDLPGNINQKIKEEGFSVETLKSNNLEELIALVKKYSIDMIVIDHYDLNYDYEKQLKEETKAILYVIDDTYEKHYCDILLNHNLYADEKRYHGLVPEHCQLKCGSAFTLLRDEFKNISKDKKRHHKKHIFLAMGGADHSGVNLKILNVLQKFPDLHTNVVTTSANQYLKSLKAYISTKKNITLHIDTDSIAELIIDTDLAIVSPSVILNEIFHLKRPFIAIKTATNQIEMYNYLLKNSYPALAKFNANELNNTIKGLLYG